jgi:hypothetical protein
MRLANLKSVLRCFLVLAGCLLTGCAENAEDRSFFYQGWERPKMSSEDQAYFYGGKNRKGAGPEDPHLPSGELE